MKWPIIAVGVFASLISGFSFGANANYCGEVQRTRVWANGSDTYGIWIEYKNNPESCSGGFYIKNSATNKQYVYSTVLAAKAASQEICIQVNIGNEIGNRCQLNYVMHK